MLHPAAMSPILLLNDIEDAPTSAAISEMGIFSMQIVREPYLDELRNAVSEMKRLVDGEPNEQVVTQAWKMFGEIKEALGQLCPNHPAILWHR